VKPVADAEDRHPSVATDQICFFQITVADPNESLEF
jgi:hypothetical protein